MSLTKFNTRIGNNLLEVVSSLEELKSLKHFNHAVLVLGATTTQDGDGGIYSWDGSNEQTPDDISLIQSDHNTIGRWKRLSYALNSAEDAPLTFSGETSKTVSFVQGNYSFSMASRFTITATSNVSWLTIGSISKNGLSQIINYEVIGNPNSSVREGVITLTNGFQTFTYVVTQGEVESVTVSSSLVFNNESRDNNITNVVSNASWSATSSVSWITLSSFSGTGNGSIQFDIEENTDQQNDRSGNITVETVSGYSQVISVTQSQGASEIEFVDEQVVDSDAATGLSFEIDSDIGWTATTSTSWITITTASGNDGDDVVYSVTENTDIVNDRTGTIIVTSTNGQNVITVDIRQTEVADAFQVKIDTTNTTLNKFAVERARNISVDWGDGSVKESTPDNISFNRLAHTYATEGEYTVSITQNDKNVVAQKFVTTAGTNSDLGEYNHYRGHHSYALDTTLTNDASNVGNGDIYSMETSQGSCDFSFNFPSDRDYDSNYSQLNDDGVALNSTQHPVRMIKEIVEWGNMTIDSLVFFATHARNLTTISNDIGSFDTSNVKSLYHTFYNCDSLTSFPLLDTSNVYGMDNTFHNCSSLTSFPLLDTSNVEIFELAWYNCSGLTSFPLINTGNAITLNRAWYNCSGLTSFPTIDTSNVINLGGAWYRCSGLTSFPLLDTGNVYYMYQTWRECTGLTSFPTIDMTTMNDSSTAATVMESLTYPSIEPTGGSSSMDASFALAATWYRCSGLTSFPGSSGAPTGSTVALDTSGITHMSSTWADCSNLTSFPLIDTSSVTGMFHCWEDCSSLTSFPLLVTSNVTDLRSTWEGCSGLTSFPEIVTSNVTDLESTWEGCSGLTSFPAIDVGKCQNFNQTWQNCNSIASTSDFGTFTNTSYTTAGATERGIAVEGSSWYKTWEGSHSNFTFTSKANSPFTQLAHATNIKVRLRTPRYALSTTNYVHGQFYEAQSFVTPLPTGSIYYPPFDISDLTSVTIDDPNTTIIAGYGSFELTGWDQMTFPLVDASVGVTTYAYGTASKPNLLTEINLNIGLTNSVTAGLIFDLYTGAGGPSGSTDIHTPITGTSSYSINVLSGFGNAYSGGVSTADIISYLLGKGWDITTAGNTQLGTPVQIGADIDETTPSVLKPSVDFGTDCTLNADGTRLAIGATYGHTTGISTSAIMGYVEIYDWSGTAWVLLDTLDIGDLTSTYGEARVIGDSIEFDDSGNRIVIGSPRSTSNVDGGNNTSEADTGRVDVFEYDPNSPSKGYVQLGGTILGDNDGEFFGQSVSINNDGTIIAASAPHASAVDYYSGSSNIDTDRGVIRVYELDTTGSSPAWVKIGNNILGESASSQGGGYAEWLTGTSAAYVYSAFNESYEFRGNSIKLSGDGHRIVIGSPMSSTSGVSNSGAVEVFEYDSTQTVPWVKMGSTLLGDAVYDNMGHSVSMNDAGDRIIMGSPRITDAGTSYRPVKIFEYVDNNWAQMGSNIDDPQYSTNNHSWRGSAVSMSADGNRIIISEPGAKAQDTTNLYKGQVQIYYWSGTAWELGSAPISNNINSSYYLEWFGTDAVISSDGSTLLVSNQQSYYASTHATYYLPNSSVYVYRL